MRNMIFYVHGLNPGPATRYNTGEVTTTAKSVWDQISRNNLRKKTHAHLERAKKKFKGTDIQFNQFI